MNTITLTIHLFDGTEVQVEMPGVTTGQYAAKRCLNALQNEGIDTWGFTEDDYMRLMTDELYFIADDEVIAPFDGATVTLMIKVGHLP